MGGSYDYVIFVANSGLRAGEASNVRFSMCPLTKRSLTKRTGNTSSSAISEENEAPEISNDGWRSQSIQSNSGVAASKIPRLQPRSFFSPTIEICSTRSSNQPLSNGPMSNQPKARPDSATAHLHLIGLLYGANPYEIANNCRTSIQMIQEHYAKWLSPVSPRD